MAKHTINVFSAVSLILAFTALFLSPLGDVVNAVIITSAAFISILVGGFYAWKEAVYKYPQAADLSIEYKSCRFGAGGSRGGIPTSPMRFFITLDAINRGQEPAILTNIKVVKFNVNNRLLANQPSGVEVLLLNTPHGSSQINFPFTVGGGQRIPNIEYRISVNLVQALEPIEFARNLDEFQNYEIELEYSFEGMNRTVNLRRILIQGSFEGYRKERLKEWISNEHQYGLALEALKAMGMLDLD